VKFYAEYETICWNDSTNITLHWSDSANWTYGENKKHNGTGHEYYTPPPEKWSHRKPTFNGFMRHLVKRKDIINDFKK